VKSPTSRELRQVAAGMHKSCAPARPAAMGCKSLCDAQRLHTPSERLPTPCKQGRTRTKLGLRDFIALGGFTQSIDTTRSLAVNDIAFSVAGLGMLRGGLRIEAAYTPVSDSRVDIKFQSATLVRALIPECSTQRLRSAGQPAGTAL